MIDWNTYKFRASSLPKLLVKSRGNDPLSETTKAYLREVFIREVYGRDKFVSTKFTAKGIEVESDSLDLFQKATGEVFFKNKKKLENDYVNGTPDVVDKTFILDIKSSWDIWTFASVDEKKAYTDYYGQMLGYMWMHGVKKARLVYCLTNTPNELIERELLPYFRNGTINAENEEEVAEWKKNYIYDDIPEKERIKEFVFAFDEEIQKTLVGQIEAARVYLSVMKL